MRDHWLTDDDPDTQSPRVSALLPNVGLAPARQDGVVILWRRVR